MKIQDVKIEFQSRLNKVYQTKEVDVLFSMLAEDVEIPFSEVTLYPEKELNGHQVLYLQSGLERLLQNEPIQYIRGKADFYGYEYVVSPHVLIPRQETEILVDRIVKMYVGKKPRIVDLCTGSGCIINTITHEIEVEYALGVDISKQALEVAEQNTQNHNLPVEFKACNVLDVNCVDTLPKVDVIVSNPPYVRLKERALMLKNVLDFEPEIALFVEDEDPLVFYEAIAKIGLQILEKNGRIICEINEALGAQTKELFEQYGYTNCEIIKDLHEKDRFIESQKI